VNYKGLKRDLGQSGVGIVRRLFAARLPENVKLGLLEGRTGLRRGAGVQLSCLLAMVLRGHQLTSETRDASRPKDERVRRINDSILRMGYWELLTHPSQHSSPPQ